MEAVEIIEEDICEKAISLRDSVSGYTEQAFKMYGGPSVAVELEFDDSLIGVVFDKFGENTPMRRCSNGRCVATVDVQISPVFWGWLFQFGKQMNILSPSTVLTEYSNMISDMSTTEN